MIGKGAAVADAAGRGDPADPAQLPPVRKATADLVPPLPRGTLGRRVSHDGRFAARPDDRVESSAGEFEVLDVGGKVVTPILA